MAKKLTDILEEAERLRKLKARFKKEEEEKKKETPTPSESKDEKKVIEKRVGRGVIVRRALRRKAEEKKEEKPEERKEEEKKEKVEVKEEPKVKEEAKKIEAKEEKPAEEKKEKKPLYRRLKEVKVPPPQKKIKEPRKKEEEEKKAKEEIKVVEEPREVEEERKEKKKKVREKWEERLRKKPVKRREIIEELKAEEVLREAIEETQEEEVSLWEEKPEEAEEEKKEKKKKAKEKKPEPSLPKKIKLEGNTITVNELSKLSGIKAVDLIGKLMELGIMANINQSIDTETAALILGEFGIEVEVVKVDIEKELLKEEPDTPDKLKPRPPVVTVMGHVDHGKTTLLDAIRQTRVAEQEAGGITQHIGAYLVEKDGNKICFIDTPGHESFTQMRARGAQVTDIVVLVVAADDGVMPQTVEAINHAKNADVPIVVAINKIDKPNADPEKVKRQLSEHGIIPEEWGGHNLFVEISAKRRQGIEELLEAILLQAEMLDLKANPDKPGRGIIIESKLDKGKGPVGTVIVKEGSIKVGDYFVAGDSYGRVRSMFDDMGRRVKKAGPSTPVEIVGFSEVPEAGEKLYVVENEDVAKKLAEVRAEKKKKEVPQAVSLEDLFKKLEAGELKELQIVLKSDVLGTLQALEDSLTKLSTDKVKVRIIHKGVGAITESDIALAKAAGGIVIGFNVRPTPKAKEIMEQDKIDVRLYSVIYELLDDVKKAMKGLLEPKKREEIVGIAEVRKVFKISRLGTVAGCYVKDGKVLRNANVRLVRDGVVIYDGEVASLKRFKDDVKEVPAGYECGLMIKDYNDIKEGDELEIYRIVYEEPEL